MVKLSVFDVVPSGFRTLMVTLPCEAIRLAATYAVTWLPLKLAKSGDPFHCNVAPDKKPDPFTVRVNAGAPAATEFGLRLDREGPPD